MGSQNKARQRGKRNEKAVAALLGGERVGLLGMVDVHVNGQVFFECKEREKLPAWLTKAMYQATKNAKGKVPVVQLHQLNDRYEKDWYMMPFPIFKEFLSYLLNKGGSDVVDVTQS